MTTPGRQGSAVLSRGSTTATTASSGEAVEEVFVAVAKEYKDGESVLRWALQNCPTAKKFVIVHVHRPSKMIPMMGGSFPASQLEPEQVEAYRNQERAKISTILEEYVLSFQNFKVKFEKLVFEMDEISKGLIRIIAEHSVTNLVMGAAADKQYSKKMSTPKSKKACDVLKKAPPFCTISFVCKGNLIFTKEATVGAYGKLQHPMASPIPRNCLIERLKSELLSQSSQLSNRSDDLMINSSRSNSDDSPRRESFILSDAELEGKITPKSQRSASENVIDYLDDDPNGSVFRNTSVYSGYEIAVNKLKINPSQKARESDEAFISWMSHSRHSFEETANFSSAQNQIENLEIDDFYGQLQQALLEAAKLKDEAHEESLKRRRAEMELLEANRRVKASEMKYQKELEIRKYSEEMLAGEKMESGKLKSQHDVNLKELQKLHEKNLALEAHCVECDKVIKEFKEKLSEAQLLLSSLKIERDSAAREVEQLKQVRDEWKNGGRLCKFTDFSLTELEQATCNFKNSFKIGSGGYGSVYKGFLRHTSVAIKILHPHTLKGEAEFLQQVEVMGSVRHPNLVTLIGACAETRALVYEFLPNGSLEDRLVSKDDIPPLPWQVRIRIITEICSALIFLHSNKPESMVHGDLRPTNILLDANFVSKIAVFGISHFVQSTTTALYRWTDPNGSFVYLDPEFFSTGELTPFSDIYSFGIVILRLLTGRPALGIVKEVQKAVDNGVSVLDPTAGEWPYVQAHQLVQLGLRCSEMYRRNRPDLVKDVWTFLESM